MTKRRTTYKIERIMNLGNGEELIPICETNNKRHFWEFLDELFGRDRIEVMKETSRTVVVRY